MTTSEAKILVVDDDNNLLELLVDTLSTIGYRVEGVSCGFDALEKLQTGGFDLLITDIKMPGMDGVSLLKKIRRSHPNLPVLFITGVASPEIIGRASPDGFLAKPFRIAAMEELIENALAGETDKVVRPIRKIMIVDDDDTFREMLNDTLKIHGYMPIAVDSAERALQELKNGEVDVVITDIKMPGMDGVALLKKIKENYPDLPVILITAFFDYNMDSSKSEEYTPDGYLEKPFKIERIINLLDEISQSSVS